MLVTFKKYNLLVVLVFLMVVFTLFNPSFFKLTNLLNILSQNSIIGIVSLGMTLVIIIGGIDLSVGSIVAFCGVLFAFFISSGTSIIFSIVICLVLGSSVGIINGILTSKGKIPPFIVTLGLMSAVRGAALLVSNSRSISISDSGFNLIISSSILGFTLPSIVFIVLTIILYIFLKKTFWGKYIFAIGGNEKAAKFNGINVFRLNLFVYILSAIMCGIASILLVGTLNSAQPQAGQLYELTAIAAVVIGGASLSGGKGSIIGTFIGVMILGVIQNGLSILNVPSYYQYILVGIIIISSVLIDKKINRS